MCITLITRLWSHNQVEKRLRQPDQKPVFFSLIPASHTSSCKKAHLLPLFHLQFCCSSNVRVWSCIAIATLTKEEGESQAQDHGQAIYAQIRHLWYSVSSIFATSCSLPTLNWNQLLGASDSTWVSTFWRNFMICIVHLSLETLRIRGQRRQRKRLLKSPFELFQSSSRLFRLTFNTLSSVAERFWCSSEP